MLSYFISTLHPASLSFQLLLLARARIMAKAIPRGFALAAAAIGFYGRADAFAPRHARAASGTARAGGKNNNNVNDAALPPLHSSYLDSLSAPPAVPDQPDGNRINSEPRTGIQAYVDTISVLDSLSDGYGAGSTNTAPYLNAMNEVCDADHAAAQAGGGNSGEPSVDCADAIADYLDVVTDKAGAGQVLQDDDSILRAIEDANVHQQQQQQQQQYQPQHLAAEPSFEQHQEQVIDEQQTQNASENMEDQYLKMVANEISVKRLNKQNPYAINDIPIDTLISRVLDNIEDTTQKNNGKTKGKSLYKLKGQPSEQRPTVVVLGTGWAAHAFTKLASTYDLRIVVVSPVNHFVFTPMLASASVGTIEYRSSELIMGRGLLGCPASIVPISSPF